MAAEPLLTPTPPDLHSDNYDPITRYNSVIDTYHKYASATDPRLLHLKHNRLIARIHRLYQTPISKLLLVLAFCLLPGLNMCLLFCFWFSLFFVGWQLQIHIKNTSIQNPLDNWILQDHICHTLDKHFVFLRMQVGDLQGFTFNESIRQELLKHANQEGKVQVGIYDRDFYDSFHGISIQKMVLGGWILLGSTLTALSNFVLINVIVDP